MLQNKEFNQAEELSKCLDDFNEGRHRITQDEEVKELVEMANLVKQSYSQGEVPQLLISELVDNLATELKAQKQQKQRRYWLYGGLSSVAAAVLIVAFIQFLLPQSAGNNTAQQIDDNIMLQKNVAVADEVSIPNISQSTNAMIEQQVQSDNSTEAPGPQSVEKKSTDDLSKVIAEIIQVVESPKTDQKPNQVAMLQKETLLQQETSNDMARTKSTLMAKTNINSLQEDRNSQLERRSAMMVLPNQKAQSITVDNTSGVIRQVYNQGTNDEIIITQRLLDENMQKTREGATQAVAESTAIKTISKDTKDVINSLTVKAGKYSITIEGKKTKEDLQKLAESLTGMK
ncbi:MAG: hypothetical protein H6Q68_43 [Firmicutes bacterium]|nr:hypothetical protein [Bacillota bacterium]